MEAAVQAWPGEQFVVGSGFDDRPGIEHQDSVRLAHGRERCDDLKHEIGMRQDWVRVVRAIDLHGEVAIGAMAERKRSFNRLTGASK